MQTIIESKVNQSAVLSDLLAEVNLLSHQQVELCYHCHKCTAGCPVVQDMQYGPDLILRMVTLNQAEAVLRSQDIWLCAGCFTCVTRCPNQIDTAAVMDALRQISIGRGYPCAERDALLFHRLFLGVVKLLGRSHEALMLGLFKILAHVPIKNDLKAGARLFIKGKVPVLPQRSRAAAGVRKMVQRSRRKVS